MSLNPLTSHVSSSAKISLSECWQEVPTPLPAARCEYATFALNRLQPHLGSNPQLLARFIELRDDNNRLRQELADLRQVYGEKTMSRAPQSEEGHSTSHRGGVPTASRPNE